MNYRSLHNSHAGQTWQERKPEERSAYVFTDSRLVLDQQPQSSRHLLADFSFTRARLVGLRGGAPPTEAKAFLLHRSVLRWLVAITLLRTTVVSRFAENGPQSVLLKRLNLLWPIRRALTLPRAERFSKQELRLLRCFPLKDLWQ